MRQSLFRELKTSRPRLLRRTPQVCSSAAKAWDGFLVEEHAAGDSVANEVSLANCVVFLALADPIRIEWRSEAEGTVTKRIVPGQISIQPANHRFSVRLRAAGSSVLVSLEPRLLACAAAEQGDFGSVQAEWAHGVDDPLLREVVLSLRTEARQSDSAAGYAQSLAQTLAAHLVRHYSTRQTPVGDRPAGLAPGTLRRTLQFIEEHLARNVTLAELAELSGLSTCHFTRMFKQSTQQSPHHYLMNYRVTRAKQMLLNPGSSVAEVALATGFCDQAHLTRCFRQFVGTTPANFVRHVDRRPGGSS